jgi:hypothetical protein
MGRLQNLHLSEWVFGQQGKSSYFFLSLYALSGDVEILLYSCVARQVFCNMDENFQYMIDKKQTRLIEPYLHVLSLVSLVTTFTRFSKCRYKLYP